MPKPYTSPILLDDKLQLNISILKKWEYLSSSQVKSGIVTWKIDEKIVGQISIKVNTTNPIQMYIELNYKFDGYSRNYKIQIISKISNLGFGNVWYFVCPKTNKVCRKLYSVNGYFFHREAFNNCLYKSQTRSKSYRKFDKVFRTCIRQENLYFELCKKHFKKYYAGIPTKKYLRILNVIDLEKLPTETILK